MKKLKITKKTLGVILPILGTIILTLGLSYGTMYYCLGVFDLPVKTPFISGTFYDGNIPEHTVDIMNQWAGFERYTPPEKIHTVDNLISSGAVSGIQEITKEELENIFPVVDQETLDTYIVNHPDCMNNGYEMLFIDEVDLMNTPTGIKTVIGDDVLAIDAINKIIIIGRDVESSLGTTSKVKLALSYNIDQFNMSLVRNLSYWDLITKHAEDNGAVLAINASGYNWKENGAYAALYGALRFEDVTYRKPANLGDVIGFDASKTMHIGYDIDNSYYAIEYFPALIKDGEVVYNPPEDSVESRSALSAIGQMEDGTIMMLVASGGVYGSELGVTYSDVLTMMNDYHAYNATVLSGGSRSIMYWNGRIVNETVDYPSVGVRLPNSFYIKYYKTESTNSEN